MMSSDKHGTDTVDVTDVLISDLPAIIQEKVRPLDISGDGK